MDFDIIFDRFKKETIFYSCMKWDIYMREVVGDDYQDNTLDIWIYFSLFIDNITSNVRVRKGSKYNGDIFEYISLIPLEYYDKMLKWINMKIPFNKLLANKVVSQEELILFSVYAFLQTISWDNFNYYLQDYNQVVYLK